MTLSMIFGGFMAIHKNLPNFSLHSPRLFISLKSFFFGSFLINKKMLSLSYFAQCCSYFFFFHSFFLSSDPFPHIWTLMSSLSSHTIMFSLYFSTTPTLPPNFQSLAYEVLWFILWLLLFIKQLVVKWIFVLFDLELYNQNI